MRLTAAERDGISFFPVRAVFDDAAALASLLDRISPRAIARTSSMSEPAPSISFSTKLRYGAEAALFFAFMGLFRALGLDAASALGGSIGRNLFYRLGTMKRARDNLRAAYPEKSQPEIEAIIKEMCDNLGRTVAEYAHLDKFSIKGSDPRLELAGRENIELALSNGKGVMFISGHFANWEMMLLVARQIGLEGGTVYRPPNNIYVDRWLVRQRSLYGPREQITKGAQGTRRIFTLLRGGKCDLPSGRSENERRPARAVLRARGDDDARTRRAGAETGRGAACRRRMNG